LANVPFLLTLSTVAVVVAALLAIVAILRARSAARRLERLSESYWELRYETGQLRSRVTRLEVTTGLRDAEPQAAAEAPRAASATTFVALSSLKKK
jgi:hypothetical protein